MNQAIGATLGDFGEFKLVREVIAPLVDSRPLDDCAFVRSASGLLAVSGDVGPSPLVVQVTPGGRDDYASGWLAAAVTVSDLTSSGGRPLFMTNLVDGRREDTVVRLREMMQGYFDCIHEFGYADAGGDLREGPELRMRTVGAALLEHGRPLGRGGGVPGDAILVVGRCGAFISAFLRAQQYGLATLAPDDVETLRRPRPPARAMQRLHAEMCLSSASDSSDGVLGALANILEASSVGAHLQLDSALIDPSVREMASTLALNEWNLFFFWGDWSSVVTVPKSQLSHARRICDELQVPSNVIGEIVDVSEGITATTEDGCTSDLALVRNENFAAQGFNAPTGQHLEYMLREPLFHAPRG